MLRAVVDTLKEDLDVLERELRELLLKHSWLHKKDSGNGPLVLITSNPSRWGQFDISNQATKYRVNTLLYNSSNFLAH